ncbi:hypothetical protein [Methylocaldum sp.]|nr:hypothetical protein [Methylocaldum sp.]HYE37019.1 hypothetical protein [Methylocaldum sp.]
MAEETPVPLSIRHVFRQFLKTKKTHHVVGQEEEELLHIDSQVTH